MKKGLQYIGLTLLLACLQLSSGFAQSEDMRALELFNAYDANIAAAGMYNRNAITLRYRQQWTGISGAPVVKYVSYHRPLGDKLNFGARLYSDELGLFQRNIAMASVGYVLKDQDSQLSFALGGGVNAQSFNASEATVPENDSELDLLNTNQISPVVAAAVFYRTERWFTGVELTNLLKANQTFLETGVAKQDIHALAQLGFKKELGDQWELRPLLAVRYAERAVLLPEVQLGLRYQKRIWLGAGMRLNGSGYGMAEWVIDRRFRLAYAYGWNLNQLQSMQQGSHELMLGFLWGKPTGNSVSRSSFQGVL